MRLFMLRSGLRVSLSGLFCGIGWIGCTAPPRPAPTAAPPPDASPAGAPDATRVEVFASAGLGLATLTAPGLAPGSDERPGFDLGFGAAWRPRRWGALGAMFHYQSRADIGPSQTTDQYAERFIGDIFYAFPIHVVGSSATDDGLWIEPRAGLTLVRSHAVRLGTPDRISMGVAERDPYAHLAFGIFGGLGVVGRWQGMLVGIDYTARGAWARQNDVWLIHNNHMFQLRVGFDLAL